MLGWAAMVGVSVLLGLGLYSASLHGPGTGYAEVAITPRPAQTVVKTKVVRKPAKTKVVYVPQSQGFASSGGSGSSQPVTTYVAPAPVAARTPAASQPRVAGTSSSNSSDDDHEDGHDANHDD